MGTSSYPTWMRPLIPVTNEKSCFVSNQYFSSNICTIANIRFAFKLGLLYYVIWVQNCWNKKVKNKYQSSNRANFTYNFWFDTNHVHRNVIKCTQYNNIKVQYSALILQYHLLQYTSLLFTYTSFSSDKALVFRLHK